MLLFKSRIYFVDGLGQGVGRAMVGVRSFGEGLGAFFLLIYFIFVTNGQN